MSPNGQSAYVINNNGTGSSGVSQIHGWGGRRAHADGDADGHGRERTVWHRGEPERPVRVCDQRRGWGVAVFGRVRWHASADGDADGRGRRWACRDRGDARSGSGGVVHGVGNAGGICVVVQCIGIDSVDSTVATYEWSFGDGSTSVSGSPSVTHTYAHAGTYTAQLTVVDADGSSTLTVLHGADGVVRQEAAATTTGRWSCPLWRSRTCALSPRTSSAAGRTVPASA